MKEESGDVRRPEVVGGEWELNSMSLSICVHQDVLLEMIGILQPMAYMYSIIPGKTSLDCVDCVNSFSFIEGGGNNGNMR